jgi:hypothetical protein
MGNCFISLALTFEPVFPENRLLSVLLSTLNLLAASETLGVSQEHRNAIASSIAFMVVEISHLEVVLMMDCGGVHCSGVCTVPGNLLHNSDKGWSQALFRTSLCLYTDAARYHSSGVPDG